MKKFGMAGGSSVLPSIYFSSSETDYLAEKLGHVIVGKFSHSIPTSQHIHKALSNIKFVGGFSWKYINTKHIAIQLVTPLGKKICQHRFKGKEAMKPKGAPHNYNIGEAKSTHWAHKDVIHNKDKQHVRGGGQGPRNSKHAEPSSKQGNRLPVTSENQTQQGKGEDTVNTPETTLNLDEGFQLPGGRKKEGIKEVILDTEVILELYHTRGRDMARATKGHGLYLCLQPDHMIKRKTN